jgi:hypothetical protein
MIFTLYACSTSDNPLKTNTPDTADLIKTAYPSIQQQASTAYPVQLGGNIINPEALAVSKEAPIAEKGKASISGLLFSKESSTILSNFKFYLSPAQGSEKNMVPPILVGPVKEKGDISGITDNYGKFEINNVEPGNYYFIVIMPTTYEIAMISVKDSKPRMIGLGTDQRNPLGLVVVP